MEENNSCCWPHKTDSKGLLLLLLLLYLLSLLLQSSAHMDVVSCVYLVFDMDIYYMLQLIILQEKSISFMWMSIFQQALNHLGSCTEKTPHMAIIMFLHIYSLHFCYSDDQSHFVSLNCFGSWKLSFLFTVVKWTPSTYELCSVMILLLLSIHLDFTCS